MHQGYYIFFAYCGGLLEALSLHQEPQPTKRMGFIGIQPYMAIDKLRRLARL
jgi:hypothetical protein